MSAIGRVGWFVPQILPIADSVKQPDLAGICFLLVSAGLYIGTKTCRPGTLIRSRRPRSITGLLPRNRDFPLDLPDELRTLTRVYAALLNARLGHGFRRGFLNANLFIGKILQ